jgi:predicted lipoprotein
MLENYGHNIIIPAYTAFQDSVDQLKTAADSFAANPTTDRLENLQRELKDTRLAWQRVNLFHFGPAEMRILRTSLNTYPADTAQIEDNIESGDYTLGSLSNQAAVGFPALGYLLHGIGADQQEIVTAYQETSDASDRMQYMRDNVDFVKQLTDQVTSSWKADQGDYIGTFLSDDNAGTDAGSSMGMMVNAFVQHYERFIRDGKIGIPSGVRSAGVPRPQSTEAYYAGYSSELAFENMKAVKRFYLGRGLEVEDGLGLHQNLKALGAGDLADEIQTELDDAINEVATLNDPLSRQIENDNESVQAAFQEVQDLVGLFKADMTSILGVTITYQDNDGD